MEKIITRNALIRSTSKEMLAKRQVEFVISSEKKDSYGTVFKMDGWDFNNYIQNPIVCYQHRAFSDDPDDIIGTSEVFIEDDKLIGRVTFEDAETNPKAEKVFKKVKNGTLKMASVGARILKARLGDEEKGEDKTVLYFTRQQLIEWSIVTAGSNPDALKRNAESINEIQKEIEKKSPTKKVGTVKRVFEAQIKVNNN